MYYNTVLRISSNI